MHVLIDVLIEPDLPGDVARSVVLRQAEGRRGRGAGEGRHPRCAGALVFAAGDGALQAQARRPSARGQHPPGSAPAAPFTRNASRCRIRRWVCRSSRRRPLGLFHRPTRCARRGTTARGRRREEYAQRLRDEIKRVIELQEDIGLMSGARRGRAQRHGAVLLRTGWTATPQTPPGLVQAWFPLRAPADHLRRHQAQAPDDRRVDRLRTVTDRQAGQGHPHRSGSHDAGAFVRAPGPADV